MEKLNWVIMCVVCGNKQWASLAVHEGDDRIRRCVGVCSDCFEEYKLSRDEVPQPEIGPPTPSPCKS